ncbi:hypothetical protein VNO80_30172 [Phaseolus coccineus]|uniref:Uncharacterized protein n=1 Tax=Phaseolus coccineus TaxID=3886 RepID=A0AAN9LFY9_PHACN
MPLPLATTPLFSHTCSNPTFTSIDKDKDMIEYSGVCIYKRIVEFGHYLSLMVSRCKFEVTVDSLKHIRTSTPSKITSKIPPVWLYDCSFHGVPVEECLHWRSFLVKLGPDNLKGVKNEELLVACHNEDICGSPQVSVFSLISKEEFVCAWMKLSGRYASSF